MKFRGFFAGVTVGLILGGVGGVVAIRVLRGSRPTVQKQPAAVTVNNEEVPMDVLQGQVLLASGPAVLRGLVEQKLIEQEAARQKVTLTPDETQQLEKASQLIKDKGYRQAALDKARVFTLARHLLLKGVTEEQIREVYDLYKPELTQYELFAIVLVTHKDGKDLQRSLQDGVKFDILAKNFSIDPSRKNGGKIGFLTMPQIRRSLGQEAADEVARLKPNQVGKMIYTPFGLTVLKVGQVKSDFKDLKPMAESLLAESRRTDLTFRLFQGAKINSPFMDAAPDSLPSPEEAGIKPGGEAPGTLPLPKDNSNKTTNELPGFKSATPAAPEELPKPKR
ncbi:hypothetical protein ABS71_16595 [bacterium SCN 62-11]|nr:peptidyl-prolyl cis-trans isomerase [Candidatus Eremiobacteraeota bacterium]ODT61850.1 MAG: hypothetical protein ABS71_16595 [bacterium SCN 62-11]